MINGLTYLPNVINPNSVTQLIQNIDNQSWRTDFKRRVQHYGYLYNYKRSTVDPSMYMGELPDWANDLVEILIANPDFGIIPDQMIINEYLPGQGISHHIDCEPCFGDVIASFSLNSTCLMGFVHAENHTKKQLLLEPNSVLIIGGEARYDWKHGIPARKTDKYNNAVYMRGRRISITFRKVILEVQGSI